MRPIVRRSKMISFRLSPEEYRTLHDVCVARGVPSISDLARSALRKVIVGESSPDGLFDEVRALKDRMKTLSIELERVSQRVDTGR